MNKTDNQVLFMQFPENFCDVIMLHLFLIISKDDGGSYFFSREQDAEHVQNFFIAFFQTHSEALDRTSGCYTCLQLRDKNLIKLVTEEVWFSCLYLKPVFCFDSV